MRKYIFALFFATLAFAGAHADPVMVQPQAAAWGPQSPRAGAQSPRALQSQQVPNAAAAKTGTAALTNAPATPSRAVATRAAPARANATPSRAVVARTAAPATAARTVRSRVAAVPANAQSASRISLTGTPMQAGTGLYGRATQLSYMSGAYATYSNIIDPMTGLISAESYNNCMQSYYTCMDEICTARSPGQRRCACAGRVKTFAGLENTLQSAREDLLKVSGELTLLIANKGEVVNAAFTLTDAEKTMNCVSWNDMLAGGGDKYKWCYDHMIGSCTKSTDSAGKDVFTCSSGCEVPKYCSDGSIGLGSNWMNVLNGSSSDIIASLRAYADAASSANVILTNNNNALSSAFQTVQDIVSSYNTGTNIFGATVISPDTLAETWGYDLFAYAHNNVCNRVLDACFNGIFETCGSDCKGGVISSNGQKQCNLNSQISVINGGQDLNFRIQGNNATYTGAAGAACFGYSNTAGDPYGTLRGPVADARRSILQKYALDSNADCDVYGEELKTQAQNIQYQKIAATQLLQQKRLEFANAKTAANMANSLAAKDNYSKCLSEILDCYNTQDTANPSWSPSRVKSYCQQIANIPSCYETMICNPAGSPIATIIDVPDSTACINSQDVTKNTCRNVVTISEILSGAAAKGVAPTWGDGATGDSASFREYCLVQTIGTEEGNVRNWTRAPICPQNASPRGGCVPGQQDVGSARTCASVPGCVCNNIGPLVNNVCPEL
ncbi:MAG: hypothetical protein FWC61_04925 [Proteobacteria bacterium]|nr:hypothetical protein [Pseudomonadota bacterium]